MVQHLSSALNKMPVYKGVVNRSIFLKYKGQENDILSIFNNKERMGSWNYPISSSKGIYDKDDDMRLIIHSKSGRDVSMFNEKEKEVLFNINTLFKFTKAYKRHGKLFVVIEEV